MQPYNEFAMFYDELTRNIDYYKRAEYIIDISKKHNHKLGKTLDLACGTGSLLIKLAEIGIDVLGVDQSFEMLSLAQMKAYNKGYNIMFLQQEMENLNLNFKIDTCICMLDSINHIIEKSKVQSVFNNIYSSLNNNGLFIFDVNTVYKNNKVLGNNTFVYDMPEVYCVWQNTLGEKNIVDIDLDFFSKEKNNLYSRSFEYFSERAYSNKNICNMLKNSGFKVLGTYKNLTFNSPKEKDEKVLYVAKKQ